MKTSNRSKNLNLLRLILPCFFILIAFLMTFQIIKEIYQVKQLSDKVKAGQSQLHEKKLEELELRRDKVIMEMDDYVIAMAKGNGEDSDEDELRIVVK